MKKALHAVSILILLISLTQVREVYCVQSATDLTGGQFDSEINVSSNGSADMPKLIGKVLGFVSGALIVLGIFVIAYGIYRLVSAYAEGNPNAQVEAAKFLAAGMALISARIILTAIFS